MRFLGLIFLFQFIVFYGEYYRVLAQDNKSDEQFTDSTLQTYLISSIEIEGNQKTRRGIILRELSFKEGDILTSAEMETAFAESRTNLLKQPLFNFVTIEKEDAGLSIVRVKIIVEERWFVWPQLYIVNNERNFNSWWTTKDFGKLDYQLEVTQYNTLGLNHILRVILSYGYKREVSLQYRNIFLDRAQHHFLGIIASYFQQKSVFYQTINDKQESFFNTNDDALAGRLLKLEYSFRPKHKSRHTLLFSFNKLIASDSLFIINPDYLANNSSENSYFELQYQFVYDRRDSRSYPLTGNLFELDLFKTGLGLIPTQKIDFFHATATVKQFYGIGERFYGAHSLTIKKSFENNQPYYFKQGLGFRNYLRGFEYYVIDGEDYYLLKNTFKYAILPTRISYLNFIPIKKFKKIHYAFYLTTFFDLGLAHEKNDEISTNNLLSNKLLYSTGLGFDIATYYDNVLRFEYSLNSMGETGLFIHFRTSI